MQETLSEKLAAIQKQIDETVWQESDFADMLKQPQTRTVFEEKVGYLLYIENEDECEIIMLGVIPDQQRKGIASTLLKQMFEKIAGKAVFLEVNEKNEPAKKLYEKHGFKVIAKRQKYYKNKDDALILKREKH